MERNDDENEEKEPIKIILLGDSGVGKTNIILRYLKNEFNKNSTSTIGTTFGVKELYRNEIAYNLNIWDTTGQEMYRSVTKLFIQGAKIVILVYCIERKATFESLNFWYDSINEICGQNVILAIVANKMDLFDQGNDGDDFISEEEGQKFAEEKKAIFKSVSAKVDKKGIDSLFDQVLDAYIEKKGGSVNSSNEEKEKSIVINKKKYQKNIKKEHKKKCC